MHMSSWTEELIPDPTGVLYLKEEIYTADLICLTGERNNYSSFYRSDTSVYLLGWHPVPVQVNRQLAEAKLCLTVSKQHAHEET